MDLVGRENAVVSDLHAGRRVDDVRERVVRLLERVDRIRQAGEDLLQEIDRVDSLSCGQGDVASGIWESEIG